MGRIPAAAKERMLKAQEEWKGEFLGTLLGFRHTKAPNQVTRKNLDLTEASNI